MNFPRRELLRISRDPLGLEKLIDQAEKVFRTWQPSWSEFVSAPLREEAIKVMSAFNNLYWYSDGGHPAAERQRLRCIRIEDQIPEIRENAPIQGIHIEGNFLFDKASPEDFRNALEIIGMPTDGLGDLWIRGNRGAQALCTPEAADGIHGKRSKVRDIPITIETKQIKELHFPIQRQSRKIKTVEASTRLDAIASAGFGLSRAKVVSKVKEGRVRLNWIPISQANKGLSVGDRIQLDEKGTLEILSLELTKRKRWRVELLRH